MTNTNAENELNAALLNHNPFNEYTVRYQNIWGQGFPDVESLNSHASDAVFEAIRQNRTTSIVITADIGTGKSHIISRIRHRLQAQGGALFVYANKYGNLAEIKQEFQGILADSLNKIGSFQVKQWQELATAMANQTFKACQKPTFSPQEMVAKVKKSKQVKKLIDNLTREFVKIKDVNNPDLVKAIFWTLVEENSAYACNWLAGKEIAAYKANELLLPTQNQSFDAVLEILDLISEYNKIVICFDELDSPEIDTDTGFTKGQIVAGLIKELFENLRCGVIFSVMHPDIWKNQISNIPNFSLRKISDYGEPIGLKFIDENSVIELVSLRLKQFYQSENLVPVYPVYPFAEEDLRKIGKSKSATVRDVLIWCRDELPKVLNNQTVTKKNPVEEAFDMEMGEDIGKYLDDNYLLAKALLFGFESLICKTVERVTVIEVTEKVKHDKEKDKYINFKIIGTEDTKYVVIGVAILQSPSGKSLGTGLSKLIDYDSFGLTRGCLVRSRDKKISPNLEKKYLHPLIKDQGGEYVELKAEEIKPLIAILSVHEKRQVDYQLSEEEILNFIAEKGSDKMLGVSNPLLQEILSDPSYQVPVDLIEDDPIFSLEASTIDDNSSNLSDVFS